MNIAPKVEAHPGLNSLAQAANAINNQDHPGSNDEDYNTRSSSKKVKKVACVECRQQKSKCDAYERRPNPCSRCSKRGFPCTLQPDYKRTYKRARIAQIEKEFNDLRKTLEESGAHGLLANLDRNSELLMSMHGHPNQQSPTPLDQDELPRTRSALLDNPPPAAQRAAAAAAAAAASGSPPPPLSRSQSITGLSEAARNQPTVIRSGIDNNINNLFGNNIPEPKSVDRVFHLPEELLHCEQKQLGSVTLSSEEITILYRDFCENYHPVFPVIDIKKGPERIYKLCPVLFWTIMFIALRRYHGKQNANLSPDTTSSQSSTMQTGVELYMKLSPLLKSVLAEITISPITRYIPSEVDQPILNVSSVFSVQALLIYTFWPPLTSSLSADTSWHTIGIALFQAIRIGLHSPGQTDSFNNLKKNNLELLNEHIRTWVGCNIVSQTIATAFGFPAFVQFDAAVLAACRPGSQIDIPPAMNQMMQIQHLEDQVAKTLNNNPMDPLGLVDATERLPLLQVLLEQLDELEIRLSTDLTAPLDDVRRFSLLSTRLHILTYHFLDTSKVASFELRRGFIRVYNAALALIAHAQSSNIRDKKFIKYLPGVYILTIWQAACIISRLIHSPYSDVLDTGAGKELYLCAVKLAMKASVMKHDMAYRSSGIMRNMWSLFKMLNEKGSVSSVSVTIRTRMCASIFFDCLWVLREECGMIRLTPSRSAPVKNGVDESDGEQNGADDDDDEVAVEDDEDDEESDSDTSGEKQTNETPKSSGSGHSARAKRTRTLSSTLHPESSARKIIRTIPLDPAPISARESGDQDSDRAYISSSFLQKVINPNKSSTSSQGSPKLSTNGESPMSTSNEPKKSSAVSTKNGNSATTETNVPSLFGNKYKKRKNEITTATNNGEAPNSSTTVAFADATENLDVDVNNHPNSPTNALDFDIDSWDSDLIWKDIDSVMNQFGFHKE